MSRWRVGLGGALVLCVALVGCGRIAPGTLAVDRGSPLPYTGTGTEQAPSSNSGRDDFLRTCQAQTTYSTDSHGNRTVIATGAGCPR